MYSLTQPAMSAKILAEKLDAIEETNADYLVTGNPGCHMQIQAGMLERGLRTKVKHLVEVLDEAYAAKPKVSSSSR